MRTHLRNIARHFKATLCFALDRKQQTLALFLERFISAPIANTIIVMSPARAAGIITLNRHNPLLCRHLFFSGRHAVGSLHFPLKYFPSRLFPSAPITNMIIFKCWTRTPAAKNGKEHPLCLNHESTEMPSSETKSKSEAREFQIQSHVHPFRSPLHRACRRTSFHSANDHKPLLITSSNE